MALCFRVDEEFGGFGPLQGSRESEPEAKLERSPKVHHTKPLKIQGCKALMIEGSLFAMRVWSKNDQIALRKHIL